MPSQHFRTLPRTAQVYVTIIVIAGTMIVAQSFYDLVVHPIGWSWTILALLTLVSGSATIRLASLPATISVSETFVFTSVLLFGASVGTLTVALDALVISLWSYARGHRLYKIVFNVCALPLTIWTAAHVFFLFPGVSPLNGRTASIDIQSLVLPLLVFTLLYFSLNSWIITFAIALEKHLSPVSIWRTNFVWVSLNYFGGASIAALLVSYTKELNYTYLAVIIPLLVVLYLTFSTSMGRVADANKHLTQLNALYMSTIETLAMAIDAKDQITHGHIRRVQTLAVHLAAEVGVSDPSLIRAIEAASLLHDMGKLAVPEYILNKPGPLTPAEFAKMKLHSSVGADILSAIDFPDPVVPIVRHHHENWDGTGYPDRLAGTDIPIGARILSVVDCFDALTSDRPYRPRLSDREALRIISERRGTMYDPLVVDTFARVHDKIAPAAGQSIDSVPLRTISEAAQGPERGGTPNRILEEISGSTEEMLTLFDLARGLTSEMELSDTADVIAKHLRRLIPCSACVLYLYDPDADELVAVHAVGENIGLMSGVRLSLGERLSGWVGANRQTIRNSDAALDLGEAVRSTNPRLRSCLSTPLTFEGDLVGVLTLYSSGNEIFSEEHERVIEIVAQQVSPMVRGSAGVRLAQMALHRDSVTGLHNIEHLRRLMSAPTNERPLPNPTSVLFINIDNLLNINRVFGRDARDSVLSRVAKVARENLRSSDLLFPYEANGVVGLLIGADKQTVDDIARRIKNGIGSEADQAGPKFSVTIATASSPDDGSVIDMLIATGLRRLPVPVVNQGDTSARESIH